MGAYSTSPEAVSWLLMNKKQPELETKNKRKKEREINEKKTKESENQAALPHSCVIIDYSIALSLSFLSLQNENGTCL